MTLDNVFIRSFQSEDSLQCQNITRLVYEEHGYIDDYVEKAIASDMADIQTTYVNIPGGHWWVAVLDKERIIGQIAVQPLVIGDKKCYEDILENPQCSLLVLPDQICELRRFAVLSEYRRQKIGSRLVRTLIEYAKTIGYKAIHLTTLTGMKSACQFYDKFGFSRGKIEQYNVHIDSNNKMKYTKYTVFDNFQSLNEIDRHMIDLPVSESHRMYIQHYSLMLN